MPELTLAWEHAGGGTAKEAGMTQLPPPRRGRRGSLAALTRTGGGQGAELGEVETWF